MFVIPHMTPGMEAIDYQKNTSLGRRLTDLFQMVIDYRDNLDYSAEDEMGRDRKEHRIRSVNNYFKTEIEPKFKKIVQDETGLTIKRLVTYGGFDYGVMGLYYVDLSFDSFNDAMTTIGRMTGTDNTKYSTQASIDEMATMAESFDNKTGKIRKPYFGKNRKFAVTMGFDINCAFLAHDFIINGAAEELTAAEIAAIIMHEIGHALTFVEHSGDMYVVSHMVKDHLNAIKQDRDGNKAVQSIQQLTEIFTPILKSWQKKILNDPSSTKTLHQAATLTLNALQGLNQATKDYEYDHESWIYTIASFTGNMLCITINFIFLTLINMLSFLMYEQLYEIMRHSSVDKTYQGGKSSDTYTNYNNLFLIERWADEFVSRHGMGAHLATGLNKLLDIFKYTMSVGDVDSARLRQSTIFNGICMAMSWLEDKMILLTYLDPLGYENRYKRLSRMLENTYGYFRDSKNLGEAADVWIRSIETLKKEQKYAKGLADTAAAQAAIRMLKDLTSPVQWIVMLRNGDLAYDVEKLENHLDAIANNPLYYRAAQLLRR